jgi:hypothetical protein
MATRWYHSTDVEWKVVIIIEAIRTLSPPSFTFPNGKAVPIKDVVRIAMLEGHKRTTVRKWITALDGIAWRVTGRDVALLPMTLDNPATELGYRSIRDALEAQTRDGVLSDDSP